MQRTWDRMGGLEWERFFVDSGDGIARFREWVERKTAAGEPVGVDSEGTGLDIFSSQFRLRLVQFGDADCAWLIPVEYGPQYADAARWALATLPRMVLHNAPFDGLVFDRHLGVPLEDFWPRVTDTRILAHLYDSRRDYEGGTGHSLKGLASAYVDSGASDGQRELQAEFRRAGGNKDTGWSLIDARNDVYQLYSGSDVVLVTRLLPVLEALCAELPVPRALIDYEHRIARIGATIRRTGMQVDPAYTRDLIDRLTAEEQQYTEIARGYGVESVNAPKQVADALAAMGETLTERTESGQYATGKEVLLPLADLDRDWKRIGAREPNPLADAVLRAKRAGKWRVSYAEAMLSGMDADGRIHPSINTLGARTARWSVSDPALQQLPSSDWTIRRCVVVGRGNRIGASDFAQVELRVLAAMAKATKVIDRINNSGDDLHTLVTRMVYSIPDDVSKEDLKDDKRRKRTKTISLGKAYAGGVNTLARQTGLPVAQVKQAVDQYNRAIPEFARYSTRITRHAQMQGCTIRTPSGRTLRLDRDKTYTAVAFMCQSSARDILGQALCDMEDAGLLPYIVGVVHDEVLIEAPAEEIEECVRRMGECMTMSFFGCDIAAEPEILGTSWAEGYKLPPEYRYEPV